MARLGQRAQRREARQLMLGIVALIAVLAIVAGAALYWLKRPADIDPTTLCPASGPTGHFVLLVDKTDPLSFTQKEAFEVTLHELIERRVPQGYLLSVFVLGEDFKENAKPLIELCNPGTGADKSAFTANPELLNRQFKSRFLEPLLAQSTALVAAQPAKLSPIFEMLQLVSLNAFRRHEVKGERRLIILSDMLQNTPQLSMYAGLPDFRTYAASDYGRKTQLELRDVAIEIHYLITAPRLQDRRNLQFWETYFDQAGARVVAVRPLEG